MYTHLRYGLSRSEWDKLIEEWIFIAEHRTIMRESILDGMSHGEIAQLHNLSVDRIRAILRNDRHTLFEKAEEMIKERPA